MSIEDLIAAVRHRTPWRERVRIYWRGWRLTHKELQGRRMYCDTTMLAEAHGMRCMGRPEWWASRLRRYFSRP